MSSSAYWRNPQHQVLSGRFAMPAAEALDGKQISDTTRPARWP